MSIRVSIPIQQLIISGNKLSHWAFPLTGIGKSDHTILIIISGRSGFSSCFINGDWHTGESKASTGVNHVKRFLQMNKLLKGSVNDVELRFFRRKWSSGI